MGGKMNLLDLIICDKAGIFYTMYLTIKWVEINWGLIQNSKSVWGFCTCVRVLLKSLEKLLPTQWVEDIYEQQSALMFVTLKSQLDKKSEM